MKEKFKQLNIENYGNILVGNNGNIIGKKGTILKPSIKNTKGYKRVHLNKMYSVARLVATVWVVNPLNKPQVNHIDGDKLNNNYKNLEWVTNIENKIHADKTGLSNATISYKEANIIRELYKDKKYNYYTLASLFNISYSMVGYIVRNKSWFNPDYVYEKMRK